MADPTIPPGRITAPPSPNGSGQPAAYCGACGYARTTGAFCQHCGSPSTGGGSANVGIPGDMPGGAPREPERRRRVGLLAGVAVVVVILLVAAAVGIVALLGHGKKHGPTYATQAGLILAPVLADNAVLAAAVGTLTPGGSSQGVRSALTTAQGATQVAQHSFTILATPKSQTALAVQMKAALTSEMAWLQTASAVLKNVASPLLSQLSGLTSNRGQVRRSGTGRRRGAGGQDPGDCGRHCVQQ
jgi:hypothetical protein